VRYQSRDAGDVCALRIRALIDPAGSRRGGTFACWSAPWSVHRAGRV